MISMLSFSSKITKGTLTDGQAQALRLKTYATQNMGFSLQSFSTELMLTAWHPNGAFACVLSRNTLPED
jgi:hypothetical protein